MSRYGEPKRHLRSLRRRNSASGRSQSPSVESATCGTPTRGERSLTSSVAAPRRRPSRTARARPGPAVSTSSWRPVSGSSRRSSPTSASSCSRGSRISTASVGWRAATRRSASLPVERAAEVRDHDDERPLHGEAVDQLQRVAEAAAAGRRVRASRRARTAARAVPRAAGGSAARRRRTRRLRAGSRGGSRRARSRSPRLRRRLSCAGRPCRTPSRPRGRARSR